MNIQSVRKIDGAIGITVFLVLAVAVIASQSQANLPKDDLLDRVWARQVRSTFSPETGDQRLSSEFSELIDRVASLQIRMDEVPFYRADSGTGKHSIAE
jgi:hypothetical protein